MPLVTANGLVDTIHELELIDPEHFGDLGALAERSASTREFAEHLLEREWLTAFQIKQVLQGKGSSLVLGPYVLMERIGAGGMGEVFKARHRRLHRIAAIKVVTPERLARGNISQRFLREAEAAAKLSHPNIVAVYDFAPAGESRYLAMEFVDGVDLSRLIERNGALPVLLACDFIRQAALGLHHAHEKGFVHRDVKPSNLLVAPRGPRRSGDRLVIDGYVGGTVKVLDMGLIRMDSDRDEATELALTQQGVVIGTLDYLSPEQARNAHLVDRRADIYSLGCTLYHLLAGQPPFPDGLPLDKLLRHQTDQPGRLAHLRPEISSELESIVFAMLAKEPDNRIQTAAAVAEFLVTFSGPANPSRVVPAVPKQPDNVFADLEPVRSPLLSSSSRKVPIARPAARGPSRMVSKVRPSAKRRKYAWLLIAAAAMLGLAFAVPTFFEKSASTEKRSSVNKQAAEIDHLRNYVPVDTAAVLHVQTRPFLTAPIFLLASKHPPLDPGVSPLLGLLGIDARENVDWLRCHFPSGDADQALWIAHGQFADDLFSRNRINFQSVKGGTDARPGLYRYAAGGKYRYAGHQSEYLLGSGQSAHVAGGLDQARKGGAAAPLEALKQLLDRAERKKPLWLAVACPLLGKIGVVTGIKPIDETAQVLVANSATIEASLDCGDDLDLRVRLQERNLAAAKQTVKRIQAVQSASRHMLAGTRPNEYEKRLWLQLLHQIKVTRDGLIVRIDSRVTAAMVR